MESSTLLTVWIVLFCRISLGLVFSISAISKAFKIQPFEKAVESFEILPRRFTRPAAFLFVAGEFMTAIMLAIGNSVLPMGFILAALLLLVFSTALAIALWRKMRISCNCFGPTQSIISIYDLWRNGGFVICAFMGLGAITISSGQQRFMIWDIILVTVLATVFITIWTNLADIAWLFLQLPKLDNDKEKTHGTDLSH
jgi:uncharacterized membrane protein YphA (DoxX/SURF4 family)